VVSPQGFPPALACRGNSVLFPVALLVTPAAQDNDVFFRFVPETVIIQMVTIKSTSGMLAIRAFTAGALFYLPAKVFPVV